MNADLISNCDLKKLAPENLRGSINCIDASGLSAKRLPVCDAIVLCYLYDDNEKPQNIPLNVPQLLKTINRNCHVPIYILDREFNLAHHNTANLHPKVVGYGKVGEKITNQELEKLIKEIIERKTQTGKVGEKLEIGWAVKDIKVEDYREENITKLFIGEMREFLNNLKSLLDSVRPEKFEKNLTKISRGGEWVTAPLLKWMEMWNAYKQGSDTFELNKKTMDIDDSSLAEARELFEKEPSNVAQTHILIRGETGVGKSLIANFIHTYYYRDCPVEDRRKTALIVSCTEFNDSTGLSALFGGVVGSWTDATTKAGFILNAYNGTLFLDEIGDASMKVQSKLLRYLDNQKFRPDGWDIEDEIYAPLLLVAATNRPIEKMKDKGEFREDLYNRFTIIDVPPFRNCLDYIDYYIDFELQNSEINYNKSEKSQIVNFIEKSVIKKLSKYDYPGNYRQFRRILKNSVIDAALNQSDVISLNNVEKALAQEIKRYSKPK